MYCMLNRRRVGQTDGAPNAWWYKNSPLRKLRTAGQGSRVSLVLALSTLIKRAKDTFRFPTILNVPILYLT